MVRVIRRRRKPSVIIFAEPIIDLNSTSQYTEYKQKTYHNAMPLEDI